VAAYQRFCWPVHAVEDLRLAPFPVLAMEGAVHVDKTHQWHLDPLGRIVAAASSPCLQMTAFRVLDLADTSAGASIRAWWEELTEQGGEGMVVKPLDFIARGRRGLVQPAMKCRGHEKEGMVGIYASYQGEWWDSLAEFDVVARRTPTGQHYCHLCTSPEMFPSRSALWIAMVLNPS
jgi:hypothetical protein